MNRIYNVLAALPLLAASVLLTSCGAYQRLAYLQDMEPEGVYDVTSRPEARISRGDELNISVLSTKPELAAPFNIRPASVAYDTSSVGAVGVGVEYVVEDDGCIEFPVLGDVYVEGLTLDQLTQTLSEAIKETRYLKDPMVKVSFGNFTVTALGEFNSPGNVDIPTGDCNIFQFLAKVGDLTQDAQRDNVWVIRTVGDARKVYSLNLKSRSVYDSPAFYLQQNDMVYAAPLDSKLDARLQNTQFWVNTPLSVVSTIVSAAMLAITLNKYYTD